MAKAKPKKEPVRWKGDAVEEVSPNHGERAAERAEGHVPVPAERAVEDEPIEAQPETRHARAPSGEDPDEKIAEAAEAHRELLASDNRPARGKL